MSDVQGQRHNLQEIRRLLHRFVQGEIEPSEFIPKLRALFGPFDPPDLSMGRLDQKERHELSVFIRLMGGWFGEHDDDIPKRADWQYGKDTEPQSWIDAPAYRRWIITTIEEAGIDLGEPKE